MCFAVPGKIVKISGEMATVEYGEVLREAKLIDSGYSVGDYVIVQARFVVQKVPEQEAIESLRLIKDGA